MKLKYDSPVTLNNNNWYEQSTLRSIISNNYFIFEHYVCLKFKSSLYLTSSVQELAVGDEDMENG